VQYAKKCDTKKIDLETIQNQAEMIFARTDRAEGVKPNEFELKLRKIITEYLTPPRSAEKLKTALKWIKRFRKEDVDFLKVEDWHELSKAVEVRFILDCAEMTARSSLKRNETRWGISDYRSDFPERDDENWLKFVDLEMDHNSGEMVVSTSPVKRRENKEAK
jgi:succinate dehydrogenase/fumarate reductase flavoprotein subunit